MQGRGDPDSPLLPTAERVNELLQVLRPHGTPLSPTTWTRGAKCLLCNSRICLNAEILHWRNLNTVVGAERDVQSLGLPGGLVVLER